MIRRRERGSAVVEFLLVTLVFVVPLFYVVVAVSDIQRASYAITAASAAGARAFHTAPTQAAAPSRLRQAVELTLGDHGIDGAKVTHRCLPRCHEPGSSIEVEIRLERSLPLVPAIFGERPAAVNLTSRHIEPFGKYRANAG